MSGGGVVLVHGGVSGLERSALPPLRYAVEAGLAGPTAVDSVEAAVMAMEDDPALNAGFGSVLNLDGDFELDAGIMDGHAGRVGAVANVDVRHPVSLARRVMELTPHVLVTGQGAMKLGRDMEPLRETTQEQRQRWLEAALAGKLKPEYFGTPEYVDTVGAVALDAGGRLAAASSTGGVFGKLPGRVGDAPIAGAGLFASSRVAVVGTGVGEMFIETSACLRVARLVEDDAVDPQAACETVIRMMGSLKRTGTAGLLALDSEGRAGAAYRGGSWAVAGSGAPDGTLSVAKLP
jgi:beta-aspartyl-peptidase (threonine type)